MYARAVYFFKVIYSHICLLFQVLVMFLENELGKGPDFCGVSYFRLSFVCFKFSNVITFAFWLLVLYKPQKYASLCILNLMNLTIGL